MEIFGSPMCKFYFPRLFHWCCVILVTIKLWCFEISIPYKLHECIVFIYLLSPWSRVLLQKLTVPQLVKKFPTFYGTRRFITAFTSTHHLSLSWARSIQSMPLSHFLKICLNITLPSTSASSKWPLTLRCPNQNLSAPLLSPIPATCPAHLILLLITQKIIGEE